MFKMYKFLYKNIVNFKNFLISIFQNVQLLCVFYCIYRNLRIFIVNRILIIYQNFRILNKKEKILYCVKWIIILIGCYFSIKFLLLKMFNIIFSMKSYYREQYSEKDLNIRNKLKERRLKDEGAQITSQIMGILRNMYFKPNEDRSKVKDYHSELELDTALFLYLNLYKVTFFERADFLFQFTVLKKNYKKKKMKFGKNSNFEVMELLSEITDFFAQFSHLCIQKIQKEKIKKSNSEFKNDNENYKDINLFKIIKIIFTRGFAQSYSNTKFLFFLVTSWLEKSKILTYIQVINNIYFHIESPTYYINNLKKGKFKSLITFLFALNPENFNKFRCKFQNNLPVLNLNLPFYKQIDPRLLYQGPSSHLLNYRDYDISEDVIEIITLSSIGVSYVIIKDLRYVYYFKDFFVYDNYESNVLNIKLITSNNPNLTIINYKGEI